jgi:ABC-type transport system involved in multi-copper enzyme maturation permease subunit
MAALLYILSQQDVLHTDPVNARTVLLLLSIMAIFFGTNNTIRDISKEGDIYQRERLAGLGVVPYIMAKVAIYSVLLAAQTLVLVVIVALKTGMPPGSAGLLFGPAIEVYLGTLLAGLAGMGMGLCVSAFANNSDKAVAVLPLVLLPQILLAGVIFALPSGPAQALSDLTISRWSVQALGTSADLDHTYYVQRLQGNDSAQACAVQPAVCDSADQGSDLFRPSDFDSDPHATNYNTTSNDLSTSWADALSSRRAHLLVTWLALLALTVLFLGAAGVRQRLKDPT